MEQEKLKKGMRHLFYHIISNPSFKNRSKVLKELIKIINDTFKHTQSALYIFDVWQELYKPETECLFMSPQVCESLNAKLRDFLENALHQTTQKEINLKQFENQTCVLIPLRPTSKPNGLMIIIYENKKININDKILYLIKEELEQLLSVLNHYQLLKDKHDKKELLFELSSSFNSTESKEDILKQFMTSIRSFYPNFSYHLLLSHDHELEDSLPVRTLEYSQEITKKASYMAFISGKLQAEVIENKTYLYAPLVGKQGVYGVLQIITPNKITFPKGDIEFITQFTSVAGKALENATLYQNSKQHVADLQMINETTHQLNSNLRQEDILRLVKGKIKSTCHATEVGFILTEGNSIEDMEVLNESTNYFSTKKSLSFCTYLLTDLVKKKEPLITGNFKHQGLSDFHSVMAIPMQDGKNFLGAVVILHEEKNYFTFDRFKLLQSLTQHLALALINSFLRDRLEEAVITDYLTKLYSRNFLEEKINYHMETDELGVLILFDIDDFKQINDIHGHYIGDEVIIQVANIIKQNITHLDVAARWGGEELAIYLPKTSLNQGVQLAEKISQQVEQESSPPITLSAGVSVWSNDKVDSVKSLFIRADQALYEAKNFGKNRVIKSK